MNQSVKKCRHCLHPMDAADKYNRCPDCRAYAVEWNRQKRIKRREAGGCIDCGKPAGEFMRCESCREKRQAYKHRRKAEGKNIAKPTPIKKAPAEPEKPTGSERLSPPEFFGKMPNYDNAKKRNSCIYCGTNLGHKVRRGIICNQCIQEYREAVMTPEELAKAEALDKKYGL